MQTDVEILWAIAAIFIIALIVLLQIARDLNISRRALQESAALLRRLAEATKPGVTADVPVTPEDEPKPQPAHRPERASKPADEKQD